MESLAPYFIGVRTHTTRDALRAVWERLPGHVRQALADVDIYEAPTPHYADAGRADVRIRPGEWAPTTAALMGIIAHELGHVAGNHYQRVAVKALSPEAAEVEADGYARAWGFADELRARRMFLGR